jgi:hypothetical protein
MYKIIQFRPELQEFLRFPLNRKLVRNLLNPEIDTRSFGRTKKSLQNEQLWLKNTLLIVLCDPPHKPCVLNRSLKFV